MVRNIRLLGLSVMAVLALSVGFASSAQAEEFTAAEYPAVLTGVEAAPHVLSFGGRKFACSEGAGSGTLAERSEGFEITSWEEAGCMTEVLGMEFSSETTEFCSFGEVEIPTGLGAVDRVCLGTHTHDVKVYEDAGHTKLLCAYSVEDVGTWEGMSYENLGGTNGIELTYSLSEIPYKRISGSALLCGPESGTATYTGASVFAAKNEEGEAIGFDIG